MPENDEPLDDARAVAMNAAAAAARVAETIIREQQNRVRDAQQNAPLLSVPTVSPNRPQDQAAHEKLVVADVGARLSPPTDGVQALIHQMRRGEHSEEVKTLVGEAMNRTPKQLFDDHPSAKTAVYRAAAEAMIGPGSLDAEDALNRLEGRYGRPWTRKEYRAESRQVRAEKAAEKAAAANAQTQPTARPGPSKGQPVKTEQRRTVVAPGKVPDLDQTPLYDSPGRRATADAEMKAAGVPAEVRNARTVSDVLNGQDPARAAAAGSKTKAQPNRATRSPEKERMR